MRLEDFLTIKKPLNRTGMFSKWCASIAGYEQYAPTREQAISELMGRVSKALDGDNTPHVLFSATHYAVVWHHFEGYAYRIRPIGDSQMGGWTMGYDTLQEALDAARKHLDTYTD